MSFRAHGDQARVSSCAVPIPRRSLLRQLPWLTAIALVPAPAQAQPGATANGLIEHGIQLREQGHDDQALIEFRKAYAISPSPRARAQMALAEQALGNWVVADQHLREALAADGDAWIASRKGVLTTAAAAIGRHLGSLEVTGTSRGGARVLLDGLDVGAFPLPRPVRVETGSRLLEVRAPGYYPVVRTLEITAGATSRETINLVANPHGESASNVPDYVGPEGALPPQADQGEHVAGAYHASFFPGGPPDGVWTLRNAKDAPLCRLPCAYWIDPTKQYVLVRASVISAGSDVRLPVPHAQLADGTEVREQIRAPTGSVVGGIALTAGGVVVAGIGIALIAAAPSTDITSDPNSVDSATSGTLDETYGILALVAGGFMIAGGVAVTLISSGWHLDVRTVSAPTVSLGWSAKGLEVSKGDTRVWLTPVGIHGVF